MIAVSTDIPAVVWFENPSWERHVLASGAFASINASAADPDGDGIPEIALAYGFGTNPARSVGNVALLTYDEDPSSYGAFERSTDFRPRSACAGTRRGSEDELWDARMRYSSPQTPE